MKTLGTCLALCLMAFALFSCESISKATATLGVVTGTLNQDQAQSIRETGQAFGKATEDITPEQEYYIGRSVGAFILDKYTPFSDQEANAYLNLLGQALATASDRPETYSGYRFLILDSAEINAFAAPGGLIFVTRGMLRLAPSEDMVAAVLAHEIGHVVYQHGLKAIKASRWTSAGMSLGKMVTDLTTAGDYDKLTDVFSETVLDVAGTLMEKGYSREQEREADREAVKILKRVGYAPWTFVELLEEMDRRLDPKGPDFAKTHPDPMDRVRDIKKEVGGARTSSSPPEERRQRFTHFLGRI